MCFLPQKAHLSQGYRRESRSNGKSQKWICKVLEFPSPQRKLTYTCHPSPLPFFHLPFLGNLKGHEQCAYTHAGEERTKKGQKNKNPNQRTRNQLHKREYACTHNATRDREIQMKQRK